LLEKLHLEKLILYLIKMNANVFAEYHVINKFILDVVFNSVILFKNFIVKDYEIFSGKTLHTIFFI